MKNLTVRQIFELKGPWTGVGSRETPIDILILMSRYGFVSQELLLGPLYSGDAIAADFAFWVGVRLSKNFDLMKPSIFLSKDGYQNRYASIELGFINAQSGSVETYREAARLAFAARGGTYGLGLGGKQLMVRNAFQLFGPGLKIPSVKILYWGIPVGRTVKVRGGTNCALQLSKRAQIPGVNLYYEENQKALSAWLEEKESELGVCGYPDNLTEIIESRRNPTPWPGF